MDKESAREFLNRWLDQHPENRRYDWLVAWTASGRAEVLPALVSVEAPFIGWHYFPAFGKPPCRKPLQDWAPGWND